MIPRRYPLQDRPPASLYSVHIAPLNRPSRQKFVVRLSSWRGRDEGGREVLGAPPFMQPGHSPRLSVAPMSVWRHLDETVVRCDFEQGFVERLLNQLDGPL